MPTIAGVGDRPQQIQGVFGNTVSVQNRTTANVYIGSDSSVSPSTGWVLPGFGTVTWQGGAQLWAVCDTGSKSSLIVSDGALQVFAPAPSHVTVDGGTVTVANASIPITGTVDIGTGSVNATISGPVSISSGNVTVGGAVTANNNTVELARAATPFSVTTAGFNLYDSTTNPDNLAPYATLNVYVGDPGALGGVATNSGVQIEIRQFSSSGVLLKSEIPEFLASGYMSYTTSLVGPILKIRAFAISTTTQVAGFVASVMTDNAPHRYYQFPGNTARAVGFATNTASGSALSRAINFTGTIAASATGFYFPETIAGPGTYMFYGAGTTGQDYTLIRATDSSEFLKSVPITLNTGNARINEGQLYFPETPIGMRVLNRDTSTTQAVNGAFVFGG